MTSEETAALLAEARTWVHSRYVTVASFCQPGHHGNSCTRLTAVKYRELEAERYAVEHGIESTYIKCILTGMSRGSKPVNETWCGRTPDPFEWCFVDASHAVLARRNKDRLIPCLECTDAICSTLKS